MGGTASGAANLKTGGLSGYAQRSGDAAKSDFNSQIASMDPGNRPDVPQYQSLMDAKTGLLQAPYQLSDGSKWQEMALQKQAQGQTGAADAAAQQSASGVANAQANLAMHGGLRGGAAERLGAQGALGTMNAQQDVMRQGNLDKLNVGLQGENMNRQSQQYNIGNALSEHQNVEQAKQQQYAQQMQAWAAQKQAQATMEAGRGKGQSGGIMGGVSGAIGK